MSSACIACLPGNRRCTQGLVAGSVFMPGLNDWRQQFANASGKTFISMPFVSCSLYNNIKPPSWLGAGTDFHLFKKGIQPKWEDPQCVGGGKWTIWVPRGGGNSKQLLDKFWLHSVRMSCMIMQLYADNQFS